MTVLYYILAAMAVLLLILLFASVKVYLEYKDEIFTLSVKIWGVRIFHHKNVVGDGVPDVPHKKSGRKKNDKRKKSREIAGQARNDDTAAPVSLREKIAHWQELYYKSRLALEAAAEKIAGKITFETLTLVIRFGDGNAATTGIETGALWGIAGGITALLNNFFMVKEQDIQIIPDFTPDKKFIEVYAGSIIKTRLAHIISVIFTIMIKLKFSK